MLLYTGIITNKLRETRQFYTENLGFKIRFENEWFLLLHTPGSTEYELGFMLPDLSIQQPIFRSLFTGKGVWLTLEVDNVKDEYERITGLGIPIEVDLRDEPWGDRHFALLDPNGIGVDIVERIQIQ